MELTMSMFATQADYWKARAELAETTVCETAAALGCEPDNEEMLAAAKNVERYRLLRRGQHWSVIDGIGDTLRADALDAAIDAKLALHNVGANLRP